ncbi:PEP/pyruvate-binding domain-containing protein [Paenibacillus sedimenti]|uniref:Phosphoenolpyruvate synthase n=1 Tax=Paenibacillus sedimenti TaxID=2770274 RepID=A0A926KKI4_9BACL|nr:PEP/pyruvate-binding domain-containing protein [Paenibacillus sedimenti]MBD0378783.1 PEP/pyruvate-binding domain-containing protein [Paenibacillus sedimenti]
MYTVTLHEACREHKRRIGSKALQLAKLTNQNIRIPGGFVITSDALHRFMSANGLGHEQDWSDMDERLADAELPDEVFREVAAAFESLQDGPKLGGGVAVRSSSSAEDLEDASFAGQYETILNVTDLTHLLESLKRCWSSLFSTRVRNYACQKNVDLDVERLPMGVLVQQMVQADVSGVVFSMNPVTRNHNEIVINASYGLGEAIVSGLVTPDCYYVGKQNGRVNKELGPKELKIVAADKETMEVETTEEERRRYCLSDAQVLDIAEQTRTIEAFFGMPVDIEFAVKDGHVYILQARPITA